MASMIANALGTCPPGLLMINVRCVNVRFGFRLASRIQVITFLASTGVKLSLMM
ncbi:hypothetical protein D3C71_1818010 [compost metagenome]